LGKFEEALENSSATSRGNELIGGDALGVHDIIVARKCWFIAYL
jgi:hypothetical protein